MDFKSEFRLIRVEILPPESLSFCWQMSGPILAAATSGIVIVGRSVSDPNRKCSTNGPVQLPEGCIVWADPLAHFLSSSKNIQQASKYFKDYHRNKNHSVR